MTTKTTAVLPARPKRTLFGPTLFRIEAIRQLRNPYTLVFTLTLPVIMYLLFGAFMPWGSELIGNGNVSFQVMVSMAGFGTATAMSSLCSLAASEVRQGWGRQIAMTPLPVAGYAFTKLMAALTFSAFSVLAVYIAGAATGAEVNELWRWFACAGIILGIGVIFGLWGMGVGMLLNPDSAAALASIAITLFGFFGNVFMPLSGAMLDIARFTPMYGYIALVRWPLTGGELGDGTSDPLWLPILSVVVWTVLLFALAYAGVVRSRRRA
ncbi:ABC transporter permease [uncultured Agrococcus sp.]|uniref:ABC transporter permease n=1 Tax=uncultured Agrococcus sp. TaxID=382258 RepID=UPI0025E46B19|nr:ABC transporter permease [uncultured Agrococcus sp.]